MILKVANGSMQGIEDVVLFRPYGFSISKATFVMFGGCLELYCIVTLGLQSGDHDQGIETESATCMENALTLVLKIISSPRRAPAVTG